MGGGSDGGSDRDGDGEGGETGPNDPKPTTD
jgi:hypothetical protein